MSLFRLNASIRVAGSHSRELADIVEQQWCAAHPDERVVVRDIGLDPVPATAWSTVVSAFGAPEDQRTGAQRDAIALASFAVDQLLAADALLFAVPLYNFGVSQHFKTWVDLVLTDSRLRPPENPLAGRPAVLVTVRGGNYSPGTPREGWDHATAWMRRILEDGWQLDLKLVESQFTLVGVDPNLDQFKDMAVRIRAEAEEAARQHGRALGGVLTA
jgi:FMN-dependent NADH-azoreductase